MASDRMSKVNENVRAQVAQAVSQDVELPLDSFVTVTRVETSRDLQHAKVFIMVLPDGKRASTMKKLQQQKGVVGRALGKALKMKYTPKVHFHFDEQGIRAQQIFDVMDQQ